MKLIVSLVIILIISGCASRDMPQQDINQTAHQQQLSDYQNWQIKGKMAFKSPEEKFSAYLRWEQTQQDYDLRLSSFIGTSLVTMTGYPGYAKLEADDQTFVDNNPSELIKRVTGWNIPVAKLSLWIKGQHETNDQTSHDEYGLVMSMIPSCDGCDMWQLSYADYRQIDRLWLPHNIELVNLAEPANQIKIRINTWQKL